MKSLPLCALIVLSESFLTCSFINGDDFLLGSKVSKRKDVVTGGCPSSTEPGCDPGTDLNCFEHSPFAKTFFNELYEDTTLSLGCCSHLKTAIVTEAFWQSPENENDLKEILCAMNEIELRPQLTKECFKSDYPGLLRLKKNYAGKCPNKNLEIPNRELRDDPEESDTEGNIGCKLQIPVFLLVLTTVLSSFAVYLGM